jgi:hypothetical protein
MIEKILDIHNDKMIYLDYLKNSELPLLLYGAGVYAYQVKDFLDNKNIKIDHVVVDKTYYEPNSNFCNIPVEIIDDVIVRLSKVNIIAGFDNPRKKMNLLSSCKKINKVIFFDLFHYSCFDKDYIKTYYSTFKELYYHLEDDLSKKILIAFMEAKYTLCSDELYKLNVKDEKQYFPSFLHLDENEVFVDCGAYDGDTALIFNQLMLKKYGGGGGGYTLLNVIKRM